MDKLVHMANLVKKTACFINQHRLAIDLAIELA